MGMGWWWGILVYMCYMRVCRTFVLGSIVSRREGMEWYVLSRVIHSQLAPGEGGVHGSPKVTAVWYDTRCDKALGPSERWILTPTGSLRLPRALGVAGT